MKVTIYVLVKRTRSPLRLHHVTYLLVEQYESKILVGCHVSADVNLQHPIHTATMTETTWAYCKWLFVIDVDI